MGIPVVGKNVFPSNIQGLPTWYEIRVSKDGYTARTAPFDLVVALNPGTYARDVAECGRAGTCCTTRRGRWTQALLRDGITILGIPFGEMCVETFKGDRERTLMKQHRLRRRARRAARRSTWTSSTRCCRRSSGRRSTCSTPTTRRSGWATTTPSSTTTVRCRSISRRMDATQRLHPDRRQHGRRARLRSTPARRSARGIRSRRPRR